MATYTDPTTLNTDPNDPVTSELMTAAIDNPVAIAEGAASAARIQPAALDIYGGTGTVTNTDATILTITDLDNTPVLLCDLEIDARATSGNTTTAVIQYRTSTDNGSTYGSYTTAFSLTADDTDNSDRQMQIILLGASDNAVQFYFDRGAAPFASNNIGTATVALLGRTSP